LVNDVDSTTQYTQLLKSPTSFVNFKLSAAKFVEIVSTRTTLTNYTRSDKK